MKKHNNLLSDQTSNKLLKNDPPNILGKNSEMENKTIYLQI